MISVTQLEQIIAISFGTSAVAQGFNFLANEAAEALNRSCTIRAWFSERRRSRGFWLLLGIRVGVPLSLWALLGPRPGWFLSMSIPNQAACLALLLFAAGTFLDYHRGPRVIPISWSFILGGYFAVVVLVMGLSLGAIDSMNIASLISVLNPIRDLVVIVGTVMGVCMTILWTMDARNLQGLSLAEERLKDGECRDMINTYRGIWAAYMLIHFFAVFYGIAKWLAVPVLKRIGAVGL